MAETKVKLKLPSSAQLIRLYLAQGMRKKAADVASRAVDELRESELRDIVRMFSAEVRARGDERKRGAPKRSEKPGWIAVQSRRALAVREYHACILSRRLVEQDELSAEELTSALWCIDMRLVPEGVSTDLEITERHKAVAKVFAADLEAARNVILPYAESQLREYGLLPGWRNPRKGYKTATLEKIAKKYELSPRSLRELAA